MKRHQKSYYISKNIIPILIACSFGAILAHIPFKVSRVVWKKHQQQIYCIYSQYESTFSHHTFFFHIIVHHNIQHFPSLYVCRTFRRSPKKSLCHVNCTVHKKGYSVHKPFILFLFKVTLVHSPTCTHNFMAQHHLKKENNEF